MKKTSIYALLCILCTSLTLEAQVIYSDTFDANQTIQSNSAYTVSLENGNLKIDGNGTAGAYNAMQYDLHNTGTVTSADITDAPRLFVKAKGTSSPVLRLDLQDEAGYVSNLQANYATLTADYAVYTFDFTGDFLDGGYGGSPCTSDTAPCPLDPALITNLLFYVNDADGGYDGIIEIEWISFGEALEEEQSSLAYSDQFEDNLTTTSTDAYTNSLLDGNLHIVANGTAGAYSAFEYDVHDAGTPATFDMSPNPKMFIKAKGTNAPVLRVDVKDAAGYVTNLQANYISLSDDYGIYTLDYAGDFLDGGFGGSPCTSDTAPCAVDPATISEIVFFVNDADGGYEGVIDIDWISIGEPLEEAEPAGLQIRYNQVAYHTGREKLINITSATDFDPLPFLIADADGTEVLSGTTSATQIWTESGEYVATVDASGIDTAGQYVIVVDNNEAEFTITDSGYEELSAAAFKYYYFNRASTEITAEFGGEYARNAGLPDTEVIIHPSAASASRPAGTIISAPKGWFDAGDYNKYVVNSGISTYTLLAAFEHFPDYFEDVSYDIPEKTNDLPDLLDEVKWNLDWMIAMQDPEDGGVYHKLTGLNFQGIIMPDQYTADRYVVQKTTAAALNLAAVAAVASRMYADYDEVLPEYSEQLLEVAEKAYTWALANPTVYYQQPSDVQTGEYGDNNVTDEFQWAAVELFITTSEQTYKDAIDIDAIGNGIPFWGYSAPLALVSIAANEVDLVNDLDTDAAIAKLLETANDIKGKINDSAMRVGMGAGDFNWGSNGQASNQLMLLLTAYQVNEDVSFLEAAFTGSDYLLGRNGTGYCFVSGFGDNPMLNPHHRISEGDTVTAPVPGMVAGGPHSGQQDGCPGYPSTAPALSYVDTWCSYSSNEVTINWNAPLFYAFTALHIYQNGENLSVGEVQQASESIDLVLYPNPATSVLQIDVRGQHTFSVEVYDLNGKRLLEVTLEEGNKALDITSLASGLYLLKAKMGNTSYTKQFVKN